MLFLRHQLTRTLLLVAAGTVLAACGGGGSPGTVAPTGPTVSGVAATGLAINNGQVTLKCVTGTTPAVSTLADGSYSVDVSNVTLPCVARVEFTDQSSQRAKLHSLVKVVGNVNITPVTDMLMANLTSSGVAADAYDKFDANEVKGYSEARVSTATQLLKTHLESKGVDTTRLPDDVIGSKFVPATTQRMGDDHDHVLDAIQDKLEEEGKHLSEFEDEMESGHETRGLSTSTGLPGDAVAGKAAYEASCLGCHGPRIADAVNSYKTMEAIKENEGGMGYLAGKITTVTADNIATYLANGIGGGSGTALQTQSITFVSPGNQTMGVATPALVATATSGLNVTITSATNAVCTVANSILTLVTPGTCSLSATQGGNANYSAALPVVKTFTVASAAGVVLQAQTITFASPGNQTMGVATPALVATATSGLNVTITSATNAVCTVANSTLTLVTAGTCSLSATQGGDANYSAALPVVRTFTVASAAGVVLPGQTITFASPGAQTVGTPATLSATSSSGLAVTFNSTTLPVCTVSANTLTLLAAGNCTVTANQAGNGSFAAAATVSRTFVVNSPAALTSAATGKTLYASCSGCHGAAASNSMNVLAGANSPSIIQTAISGNMGGMGGLSSLTSQNLADIAAYLATPNI